jgi:hypothetical protein
MKYEIILWGNSSDSKKVFITKEIRLMMGITSPNSCRDLFKILEILTLPCEHIFSSIKFITNNEHFQTNADVHSINTRHKHYLHKPAANLSCLQKSTYYAGIRIFNNLPSDIKSLRKKKHDLNSTKTILKCTHSTLLMNTYCLKSDSSI